MEAWCFDSLDKGFASDNTISPSDIRNKSVWMGWELKPSFSYENSVLVSSQQSVENSCFPEVGIPEMIREQCPHDSTRNVLDDNASVGDIVSPSLVTSNGFSGDEESSSKFSSSAMDSNNRESSMIDLKLGGFGDKPHSNSTRTAYVVSSAESSTPPKRAQLTILSSQTAHCQVYGCNKDLSSAKDYHKRHKVCDVHSKTSKVIVNGIEQRFCQQCSRFHLLGEFDDGKRSCRKRLAGHNERRRKPQVGLSSRSGRSFQPYTGNNFQGFTPTSTSTSFICENIFSRGTSHIEKYGTNDWVKNIKVEDGSGCVQNSAYNCIHGQLQQNSVAYPYVLVKQFPSIDNTNNTGKQSIFGENGNQCTPEVVSHSLFQTNSPGGEGLTLLDAASTPQGLPRISESGCALSLLSSESWNSSGHSSGMPGCHPSNIPSSSSHYSVSELSKKPFGVGTQALTSGGQPSSMLLLNNGNTAHSGFGNEIHCSSKYTKDHFSCEDGTTIDLLQLSSQLHRVENRRQSEPVTQENEGFFCLSMI